MKEFNSLKGVLALMIFAHHCPLEFEWKTAFGIIAVSIFFMLSGFLSAVGYRDKVQSPSFSYKQYIVGKSTKFYPLHLLFLITSIPLSILNVTNWISYLATFVFNASLLQSIVPIKNVYFSFNAVSWFLSDTMIFVALFPLIMRWMLNARAKTKTIVGLFAIAIYLVAWLQIPEEYTHQFFYISPIFRLFDFVIGMQCGLWFINLKEQGKLNSFIDRFSTSLHWLGIVLLIGLTYMATFDVNTCLHSIIYMPCACILLILIGLNGGVSSIMLQEFGKISFAFFLSHQIVLRYLRAIVGKIGFDNNFVTTIIAFLLSIVCSYILTYYFDKNISLWLKKKINRQSMTAQS